MKGVIASALALMLAGTATVQAQTAAESAVVQAMRARTQEQEIIYFVLPDRFENGDRRNDRGGLKGDRLKTGYDPAAKGFYHGGDLAGLTARLDYIQGLGATAIWFAPVFKNKVVQGPEGDESAGYHGYWVTDFTQVDPHFGTNAEFKAFVDAAHARGLKVYMDIITNHTADVIRYREGEADGYQYRGKGAFPFTRRGGVNGASINDGFVGDNNLSAENWARLSDPSFAYTPYVPTAEANVKSPAWLNDPIHYHNRGNSTFEGESSLYGDFMGLDDLATEHPRVVEGFIEVYGSWIDRFGIDGFRVDTAKHVNPEFWQAFVPAMEARAAARGIPNFHVFGEVATGDYDPALLARFTHTAGMKSTLDMAFSSAVTEMAGGKVGHDKMARIFDDDALYLGGQMAAMRNPTFIGNHDFGRASMLIERANPGMDREELLSRTMLAYAMLMTMRGAPVIYYGDEQGFVSDNNDQLAREDMFSSQVAAYNDNDLLGTDVTTASANFDVNHPLYRMIADLADIRKATPALQRGQSVVREWSKRPGLYVVSRIDPVSHQEVLLAFNTGTSPVSMAVPVEHHSRRFSPLSGQCSPESAAPGSVNVTLAPLSFSVCASTPLQ